MTKSGGSSSDSSSPASPKIISPPDVSSPEPETDVSLWTDTNSSTVLRIKAVSIAAHCVKDDNEEEEENNNNDDIDLIDFHDDDDQCLTDDRTINVDRIETVNLNWATKERQQVSKEQEHDDDEDVDEDNKKSEKNGNESENDDSEDEPINTNSEPKSIMFASGGSIDVDSMAIETVSNDNSLVVLVRTSTASNTSATTSSTGHRRRRRVEHCSHSEERTNECEAEIDRRVDAVGSAANGDKRVDDCNAPDRSSASDASDHNIVNNGRTVRARNQLESGPAIGDSCCSPSAMVTRSTADSCNSSSSATNQTFILPQKQHQTSSAHLPLNTVFNACSGTTQHLPGSSTSTVLAINTSGKSIDHHHSSRLNSSIKRTSSRHKTHLPVNASFGSSSNDTNHFRIVAQRNDTLSGRACLEMRAPGATGNPTACAALSCNNQQPDPRTLDRMLKERLENALASDLQLQLRLQPAPDAEEHAHLYENLDTKPNLSTSVEEHNTNDLSAVSGSTEVIGSAAKTKKETTSRPNKCDLLEAARTGNEELLLSSLTVVNVNCHASDGRRSTPLHLAAGYNRVRIVELLLRHGASVHAQDKGGKALSTFLTLIL